MSLPFWKNCYETHEQYQSARNALASSDRIIREIPDLPKAVEGPALFTYLSESGVNSHRGKQETMYQVFKSKRLLQLFRGAIYSIKCIPSGCEYIGKTESRLDDNFDGTNPLVLSRIKGHFSNLKSGTHALEFLQKDWDEHGISAFNVAIKHLISLKDCRSYADFCQHLYDLEVQEINSLPLPYNLDIKNSEKRILWVKKTLLHKAMQDPYKLGMSLDDYLQMRLS